MPKPGGQLPCLRTGDAPDEDYQASKEDCTVAMSQPEGELGLHGQRCHPEELAERTKAAVATAPWRDAAKRGNKPAAPRSVGSSIPSPSEAARRAAGEWGKHHRRVEQRNRQRAAEAEGRLWEAARLASSKRTRNE